ncbi:MAG: VOC family protein [Acidimicrobiales bacterium]
MSETNTITPINLSGAVTWFEVGTPDPAGARRFYGDLFGWTFELQGPYSVVTTGDGHNLQGGINDTGASDPGTPATYAIPYVQVADVAETCAAAERLGGKVVVPRTEAPGGLVFAHVLDPTGGHIGVWAPPSAE